MVDKCCRPVINTLDLDVKMIKTPNVSSQKNLAKVSVKIENGVADLSNVMFLDSLDHRPTVSTDIYMDYCYLLRVMRAKFGNKKSQ